MISKHVSNFNHPENSSGILLKLISFFFLLLIASGIKFASAQQAKEDSLQKAFLQAAGDSATRRSLQELTMFYMADSSKNKEEALQQIQRLIQKKDPKLSNQLKIIRVFLTHTPDSIIESRKLFNDYLQESRINNDSFGYIDGLMGFSYQESRAGNYQATLQLLMQALNYARDTLHDKEMLSGVYGMLGVFYFDQLDTLEAIAYNKKALETTIDPVNIASWSNNIAMNYQAIGSYDSAKVYYKRSIDLFYQTGTGEPHKPLINLAELFFLKHEYDSSLYYARKAINEAIRLNGESEIGIGYHLVAKVFRDQTKPDSAMKYYELARENLERTSPRHFLNLFYADVASFYESQGKFHLAYKYLLEASSINDSIYKTNNNEIIKEMEARFRAGEKEKEIVIQEEALKRQQTISVISFAGAAVLLVFIGIISYYYLQKRKSNRELSIAKTRAEQSEKFKQQFLANMSHEIRTPMNAIMGMTDLVLNSPLNEKQRNYLTSVKKASDNLLHIINDILDLSKVEAGKIDLEEIDFSIRDMIEQVRFTLIHKADEKEISLITTIDNNVPDVLTGDPMRLTQVLINLAGNAIKFTEKGSVMIEVIQVSDGKTKFSVIDTGIGIPNDKLQDVFESFNQAHTSDSRKYGGTGLGLTISRQFIELMSGNLEVESEVGVGSTFSFTLELPVGDPEKLAARTLSDDIDGSILDGLKILLTDDNVDNRIVARDTLHSRSKVNIMEAVNGKDALEKLSLHDFDLVLMDIQMPLMDGYEATRQIRNVNSNVRNHNIPVIALTASVIRSDLEKCRQAGMNDYVIKPFKPNQLISVIGKLTGKEIRYKSKSLSTHEKHTSIISSNGVINLTYLKNFCEGDKLKMNKYIGIFLDTAPALIINLEKALSENNFKEIATQIHGFKIKWVMMGMGEASDLALKIETGCRQKKPEFSEIKANTTTLINLVNVASGELKIT